jgi:hypothetical protein
VTAQAETGNRPPLTAPTPTWNHPLFGADPVTLFKAFTENGALPVKQWPMAAAMMGAALARSPFSAAERLYVAAKEKSLPETEPPIFILGHWRSGTTHLYNTLSRDPQFAFVDPFATGMPWDFLLLGRWLQPLLTKALPADRFIDRVAVNPDSPQEDEIGLAAMQNLSYYFGIYFPQQFDRHYRQGVFLDDVPPVTMARWRRALRHYFAKLKIAQPGQRLVIKNPVYTGRVDLLRQWFPNARFIHIYRNPYVVFQSTRKFYRSLFPRLAMQPFDETQADKLILETYPRMLANLKKDTADLPPERMVTLRFEDLESDPETQLEAIYRQLEIPGFEHAHPIFREYLESVSGYRKNSHGFPTDAIELVDEHWGDFVREWDYQPPA